MTSSEAGVSKDKKALEKKSTKNISFRTFMAGSICALILVSLGVIGTLGYQRYIVDDQISQRILPSKDGNTFSTTNESNIASVASKVSPSVVSILTTTGTTNSFAGSDQAAGSGIIVSKDGVILTNKHVVDGAASVQVIASDGATYSDVKVLGTDPLNDIAYLKIDNVDNLTPAELGDSSTISIGQGVIAIGNSLGEYQNTVTSGIISGTNRPLVATNQDGSMSEALSDLIQTDAAINPGNSGGPLLNSSGQVIGINTAIAEDAEGIGFAIPINSTKGTLKGVLKNGKVERAYIGVHYLSITPLVKKEHKLDVSHGAYVVSERGQAAVIKGSPADKAGIKTGDIIVEVNGIEVGKRGSVSSLISEYSPGDKIRLKVISDSKTKTLNVELSAYKD